MNNEWTCPLPPEKIPANFEWVAQDMNGYWFAYEVKPKLPRSRNMFLKVAGESMQIGFRLAFAENWRNTLKKIPR
jgi:hypothetical protein